MIFAPKTVYVGRDSLSSTTNRELHCDDLHCPICGHDGIHILDVELARHGAGGLVEVKIVCFCENDRSHLFKIMFAGKEGFVSVSIGEAEEFSGVEGSDAAWPDGIWENTPSDGKPLSISYWLSLRRA